MNANSISTKDIGWSSEKVFIEIGFIVTQGSHNSDSNSNKTRPQVAMVVEIASCKICVKWDFRFNSTTSFEAGISMTIFSSLNYVLSLIQTILKNLFLASASIQRNFCLA